MKNFNFLTCTLIIIAAFPLVATAGEYDAEISKYQKVIANDSTNLDAAYQLGNLLSWDGRYDEAIVVYEQVLVKEPDYEDATIGIARSYAWKGDQNAAIAKY